MTFSICVKYVGNTPDVRKCMQTLSSRRASSSAMAWSLNSSPTLGRGALELDCRGERTVLHVL